MQPIEIIVIISSILFVGGYLAYSLVNRKRIKKSGCKGICSSCPYCSNCKASNKE